MSARPPIDFFRKLRDIQAVTSGDLEQFIGPTDWERLIDTSLGPVTVYLRPATGSRHLLHLKCLSDDNIATILPNGADLIDDAGALVLANKWSDAWLIDAAPGYWDNTGPTLPDLLPVGGTTGQILAKASNDDGDVEWIPATGIPPVAVRPTTINEIIAAGVELGLWP